MHGIVEKRYDHRDIQAVNKAATALILGAMGSAVLVSCKDLKVCRMEIRDIAGFHMERMENSGFFLEHVCEDVMDMRGLADDPRCQTVSVLGNREMVMPLIKSGHGF